MLRDFISCEDDEDDGDNHDGSARDRRLLEGLERCYAIRIFPCAFNEQPFAHKLLCPPGILEVETL